MASRYIDAAEAAGMLDVPVAMLATFIRRGNLTVAKNGRFIRSDVERFQRLRVEAQRPPELSRREQAAPIIARVLQETQGQDEKAIKAALRDAYPWGERALHPYKVWCDEIRYQRGLKPKSGARKRSEQEQAALDAQGSLF